MQLNVEVDRAGVDAFYNLYERYIFMKPAQEFTGSNRTLVVN